MSAAATDGERARALGDILGQDPDIKLDYLGVGLESGVDGADSEFHKERARDGLRAADLVLCLVSERTHEDSWVGYELAEAQQLGLPMLAMAFDGILRARLPIVLIDAGISLNAWDPAELRSAIHMAPLPAPKG